MALTFLGVLKNHPEPAWLSDDATEEDDGEGGRARESEKSSTPELVQTRTGREQAGRERGRVLRF